jgi:glutaredoxin-like YruB-family protein
MKDITIYSTPSCTFCNMAKDFFKENDIAYTEYNVAEDEAKREEMVEKSGQMGVPVIFIGEEMIIGFEEGKVKEMLGM